MDQKHSSANGMTFGIYLCCLTWMRTFCISPRLYIPRYVVGVQKLWMREICTGIPFVQSFEETFFPCFAQATSGKSFGFEAATVFDQELQVLP